MRFLPSALATLVLTLAFAPPAAHAISEKDYAQVFESQVRRFWEVRGNFGTFEGARGKKISYAYFEQDGAANPVVLLPGRTEAAEKYAEVVYDLSARGYSVYVMDHRGQGASDRLLGNPLLGYVDRFDDYSDDVETFVEKVVAPRIRSSQQPCLLAHSMGGAIGARHLQRFPHTFKAAVLVSPMFQIDTAPYPDLVAELLAASLTRLGKGREAAPKGKNGEDFPPFERNVVTRSRVRFEMNDELLARKPELKLGGPTNRWVLEGLRAGKTIRHESSKIATPVYIFQAGHDRIVKTGAHRQVCAKAADCQIHRYPYAEHEILMEIDAVRDDAVSRFDAFCGSGRRLGPSALAEAGAPVPLGGKI